MCLTSVRNLCDTLEFAKRNYVWDIGDMCLEHCEQLFQQLPEELELMEKPFSDFIVKDIDLRSLHLGLSVREHDSPHGITRDIFSDMEGLPALDMSELWGISDFDKGVWCDLQYDSEPSDLHIILELIHL